MFRITTILLAVATLASADPAAVERARELYRRTRYEEALRVLVPLGPTDGAAQALIGKSFYMLGDFKKASEAFQKAVAAEPLRSEYHHWLGRTWGRRAETSGPFTAPGYASKARQSFEKAVELDPRNLEAASDLFEYYLQAPGFLGGGFDKAAALAERTKDIDPAEYYYAQARLAEKRKQFQKAEEQLRRAAELAPRQAGRLVDLAKFLAKQGRVRESEAAFRQAESIDPTNPRLLFERANSYIRGRRNLDVARDLLKRYLEANLTPDDPPREEAEKLLKQSGGV